MNIKKLTPDMMYFVKNAIRIGIPVIVIASVCEVSLATLTKNIKDIKKEHIKEFTGNKLRLEMLKLYAWAIADKEGFNSVVGYHAKIIKALYKYLKLDKWEKYLNGVTVVMKYFQQWSFEESVPVGYREFFLEIYSNNDNDLISRTMLDICITEMHTSQKFPYEDCISFPEEALSFVVNKVLEKEKMKSTFLITNEITNLVDTFVSSLSNRMQIILKKSFGICGETQLVPKAVADIFDLTVERVRSIKKDSLKLASEYFKSNNYTFDSCSVFSNIIGKQKVINKLNFNSYNQTNLIAELNSKVVILSATIASNIKNILINNEVSSILLENGFNLENSGGGIIYTEEAIATGYGLTQKQLQFLKSSIRDVDFSVRAYNCLTSSRYTFHVELVYVWQILEHHEELLKIRNMGKKTLIEIEEAFSLEQIPFKSLNINLIRYLKSES